MSWTVVVNNRRGRAGPPSSGGGGPVSLGVYDVFLHADLPDPARFGGPGDGMCDGVGIDDVGACLDAAVADLMAVQT